MSTTTQPNPGTDTTIDPAAEIVQANAGRKPKLVALKYEKMAADVFAFFRGTLHLFAKRWSSVAPADAGPDLLSCGDLHLENFGAYETPDHVFLFDINDFDEALLAPASFDLVRATTSVFLAGDAWHLDSSRAAGTAQALLNRYSQAVKQSIGLEQPGELTLDHGSGPLWELLGQAAVDTVADLLDHHTRLKNGRRTIDRKDGKHYDLNPDRVAKITTAVEGYGQQQGQAGAYKVLDVTGRIAGVGSLGVRRALVLVEGEGSPDGNQLLDIKEALPSAALPWLGHAMPGQANEAQRVVDAQRVLQARPPVGLDVMAIGSVWYRIRAMVPDENRSKLDRLQADPQKLLDSIEALGDLIAWSHVRGARFAKTQEQLAAWAAGSGPATVLTAAGKGAEQARADYKSFHHAYQHGQVKLPSD